jgi:hypothetical protein
MGLDMYAWVVSKDDAVDDLTIRTEADGRTEEMSELYYWRKHHDLHGWMERLYRNKGGDKQSFNCCPVRLHENDLNALEFDLLNNMLPKTQGYFFGTNPPDDESLKDDLKFIELARDAIKDGNAVYYDSWW